MDRFVVDSGPFIHLEQINQLTLLRKLPSLIIPPSVDMEIKQGALTGSLKTIRHWPNAKIVVPRAKIPEDKAVVIENAGLHTAEIDCIYLACQAQPCILLTDDLSARTTAEKLSIETHGTVGIIAYGFRHKWLSLKQAEESLNLLYHRSSLFITYAIIEEAIRSLRNSIS